MCDGVLICLGELCRFFWGVFCLLVSLLVGEIVYSKS